MEINSYFILSFLLSSFKKKKSGGRGRKQRRKKSKQIFSLCISFGKSFSISLYIYLDFFAAVVAAIAFLERYSNIEPLTLV